MLNTLISSVTYQANGSTKVFAYAFKIWRSDELEIWLTDADGNETEVTSNYNITGIGQDGGGNITYPVTGDAVASGYQITLRRVLPLLQDFFDIENSQAFNADTLEDAVDKLMAIIQQINTTLGLCFRAGLADAGSVDPELPAAEAGKALVWNAAEDALENAASTYSGAIPAGSIGSTELGADSVTAEKVNADVAGDGLVQAVDGSLEVNDDDSTLEIATDILRVKDAGITNPKLASDAVDGSVIDAGASTVFVSSNDTTPGVLNGKLVAGDNITLTEGVDGGNETLTISAPTFQGCYMHLSGSIANLSTATEFQINIGYSEIYDTDDFHDPVTNNERITIPADVTYVRLTASVYFAANATGFRRLRIIKNGAYAIEDCAEHRENSPSGSDELHLSCATHVIEVAENDYFEMSIYQTSGGTLNFGDAVFSIEVVG